MFLSLVVKKFQNIVTMMVVFSEGVFMIYRLFRFSALNRLSCILPGISVCGFASVFAFKAAVKVKILMAPLQMPYQTSQL